MAKKLLILEKNQTQVKFLQNGDLVTINHHDYFYKGLQEVLQNGLKRKQLAFWSTSKDYKKYFNLELLEHVITQKTQYKHEGYNW